MIDIEELEIVLISLTEELLSRDGVLITDDFLRLGGASLAAARLTLRLEHLFEIDMPQSLIFDTDSLRELAEQVHELIKAKENQAENISTG